MINATYYWLEQKTYNKSKGLGVWEWTKVSRETTDKAELEKRILKEKNGYLEFIERELKVVTDKEVLAHLNNLKDNFEFRIAEENKTFTHASHYGYSDVNAYEIVKVISDKTIEVRKMDTKHDISHLKQYAGGFAGHVADQRNQKVTYASNPNAEVIRIRRKKHNPEEWGKGDLRFGLKENPYAFYDYNF